MCGWLALFSSDPNVFRSCQDSFDAGLDLIKRRGPDGVGRFSQENVLLGHRRLAIIDVEGGHQPISDTSGRYTLVFNGEIYNFEDLRKRLNSKKTIHWKTRSDTEVLLYWLMEYGVSRLHELNGIFSFALWDQLEKRVMLARDPFGVKPMYWSYLAGLQNQPPSLIAGSELKALMPLARSDQYPTEIDLNAVHHFLSLDYIPSPLTIWKNFFKLEPGHFISWKVDSQPPRPTPVRYWDALQFSQSSNPRSLLSEDLAVDQLDDLLRQAIKRQMVSDVEVSTFLSGGIDSSLISYYASKESSSLKTMSISFEQASFDESRYASQVAQALQVRYSSAKFSAQEFHRLWQQTVPEMDEPFADPSFFPTHFLSSFTSKTTKVALSGDGADELFGGYPTLQARKFGSWLPQLPLWTNDLAESIVPFSDNNLTSGYQLRRWLVGKTQKNRDLGHCLWTGSLSPEQQLLLTQQSKSLSAIELSARNRPLSVLQDWTNQIPNGVSETERSLWIDFRFYLQENMFSKVDRASMMNGLEVRVPFLDLELAKFALQLPDSFKLKGLQSKYLLKKVASRHLPQSIVQRKKKGFGIPVSSWLRSELKDELLDLRNGELSLPFNSKPIKRWIDEHLGGRVDRRKELFSLLILNRWLKERTWKLS